MIVNQVNCMKQCNFESYAELMLKYAITASQLTYCMTWSLNFEMDLYSKHYGKGSIASLDYWFMYEVQSRLSYDPCFGVCLALLPLWVSTGYN